MHCELEDTHTEQMILKLYGVVGGVHYAVKSMFYISTETEILPILTL
jgi:hypothetical protein